MPVRTCCCIACCFTPRHVPLSFAASSSMLHAACIASSHRIVSSSCAASFFPPQRPQAAGDGTAVRGPQRGPSRLQQTGPAQPPPGFGGMQCEETGGGPEGPELPEMACLLRPRLERTLVWRNSRPRFCESGELTGMKATHWVVSQRASGSTPSFASEWKRTSSRTASASGTTIAGQPGRWKRGCRLAVKSKDRGSLRPILPRSETHNFVAI